MDAKPESTHTSTSKAYRVEVRATNKPLVIDGWGVIGSAWMGLPIVKVHPPGAAPLRPEDELTYTYSYYGAIALAASFLAHYPHYLGLECRLIEYQRVINYTLTKMAEQTMLGEFERVLANVEASRRD